MPIIILIVLFIIAEKVTGKSTTDLITLIIQKIWAVIEWVILFLTNMNEPPGGKS
jgi:hypothetical protein